MRSVPDADLLHVGTLTCDKFTGSTSAGFGTWTFEDDAHFSGVSGGSFLCRYTGAESPTVPRDPPSVRCGRSRSGRWLSEADRPCPCWCRASDSNANWSPLSCAEMRRSACHSPAAAPARPSRRHRHGPWRPAPSARPANRRVHERERARGWPCRSRDPTPERAAPTRRSIRRLSVWSLAGSQLREAVGRTPACRGRSPSAQRIACDWKLVNDGDACPG